MEYSIQDIIDATVEGEPLKVQSAFDHLIGQKIMDSLETKKREVAASMFKGNDEVESEDNTEVQNAEDQDTQSA